MEKYLTGQLKFNDIKISSNDDVFYGFDKKRNDQLIVEAKKR